MAESQAFKNAKKLLEKLGAPYQAPSPAPLAGNTSMIRNAPGDSPAVYGASGRGEFYIPEERSREIAKEIDRGVPTSMIGDRSYTPPPPVNANQAASLAKQYGLQGMNLDKDFIGLSPDAARAKALKFGQERKSQVSANTSYGFDPKTLAGMSDTLKKMKIKLDEFGNNPLESGEEKDEKKQAILKSYSSELAGMFGTLEQFNSALQNPQAQQSLQQYEQMGGDIGEVAAQVENPVNRFAGNIADYLGDSATPAEQQAAQSLFAEGQVAQDEISFEQSIPQEMREHYFGTPEKLGLVQQMKLQKQEEIKLVERRAKMDEKNARAQVDFAVQKGRLQMDLADATIQENHMNAKNYITGQLAKLGALKTSSGAPQAVASIDQKYQQQRQVLRSNFDMAVGEMELDLTKTVDDINIQRDEDILSLKQDMTKSESDMWKEVFKLQNDADRKSFGVLSKFTTDFRKEAQRYENEAKKEAEKALKAFQAAASKFTYSDVKNVKEGGYVMKRDAKGKVVGGGILAPEGNLRDIAEILESSKGSDGYVNSATYQQMLNEFTKAGGTRTEFLKKFPPNQYTNPQDSSLPSFLRFGSSSRAEANVDDDDDNIF